MTPKKESRVLRQEQTYTTTKKRWPILWLQGEYRMEGKRSVEVAKSVFIELFRGVEFFPSRFVRELLKDPTLLKGRDPKEMKEDALVERLVEFLEAYVERTRHVDVMYFERRPRPNTQIELEEELKDAYATSRQQASVIASQEDQLADLRKRLAAAEKKGG